MKTDAAVHRYFRWITQGYLFLLAAVYALVWGTGNYQTITAAKHTIFCVLCGGYILIMLAVGAESMLIGVWKPKSPLKALKGANWPQKLAAFYLLFTWISALVSSYFPETVTGGSRYENALTITLYVASFLLISVFGEASRLLLWGLGCSAVLFCSVCFLQFRGLNPFSLYPEGLTYYDAGTKYAGEYLGTIGNVDIAAAFLCIAIPVFWIALLRLSGKKQFLLLIPLVFSLGVLLKMRVLAGFVGIFLGGLLSLPAVLPLKKRNRLWVEAAVAASFLLGVFILYFIDFENGLFHELHQVLHGNFDGSFGSGRLHIWKEVLNRVPEHFWLGAGPDTMVRANLQPFEFFDEAQSVLRVGKIDVAHNEYLNVLYHQGFFALLFYLAMLTAAAVQWIKKSKSDGIAAILGGACLCYCIQAFFGFSVCITAPFFWAVLGLLCGRADQIDRIAGGSKNVEKAH